MQVQISNLQSKIYICWKERNVTEFFKESELTFEISQHLFGSKLIIKIFRHRIYFHLLSRFKTLTEVDKVYSKFYRKQRWFQTCMFYKVKKITLPNSNIKEIVN